MVWTAQLSSFPLALNRFVSSDTLQILLVLYYTHLEDTDCRTLQINKLRSLPSAHKHKNVKENKCSNFRLITVWF